MATLKRCIDTIFGSMIPKAEADIIKASVEAYKEEGSQPKQANVYAVQDYLDDLKGARENVISEINKALGKENPPPTVKEEQKGLDGRPDAAALSTPVIGAEREGLSASPDLGSRTAAEIPSVAESSDNGINPLDETPTKIRSSKENIGNRKTFGEEKIVHLGLREALEKGMVSKNEAAVIDGILQSFPEAWREHFEPRFSEQEFAPTEEQADKAGYTKQQAKTGSLQVKSALLAEKMGPLQTDAKHLSGMFKGSDPLDFIHEIGEFVHARLLTPADVKNVVKPAYKEYLAKAKADKQKTKERNEWFSDQFEKWWFDRKPMDKGLTGIFRKVLAAIKGVADRLKGIQKTPKQLAILFEDIVTNGKDVNEKYYYTSEEVATKYIVGSDPTHEILEDQGFSGNSKTHTSWDPSALCPKQDRFIQFLTQKIEKQGLKVTDLLDLKLLGDFYDEAVAAGIDVPCSYCYVEQARRKAIAYFLQGKSITGVRFAMAKEIYRTVPYTDKILKMSQSKIDDMNRRGGLRLFSFSDYIRDCHRTEVDTLLTHAEKRGLSVKAITKNPDFVEDFADRGIVINMSIDMAGEGMDWDKAAELKKRFPENVKVRSVALNLDEVVELAELSHGGIEQFVDVITPYHHDDKTTKIPEGYVDMGHKTKGGKQLRQLVEDRPDLDLDKRLCCQVGGKCYSKTHKKQCAANCGFLAGNLAVPSFEKAAMLPMAQEPQTSFSLKDQQAPAPIFFSKMQQTLEAKLPGSGTADQLMRAVTSWASKGEFKAEELQWSGLKEWLEGQKGKVSKQDVIDFLRANKLQIKEVVKGTPLKDSENRYKAYFEELEKKYGESPVTADLTPEESDKFEKLMDEAYPDVNDTSYDQYQLSPGQNYRELLLTLPEVTSKGSKQELRSMKDQLAAARKRTDDFFQFVRVGERTTDAPYGYLRATFRKPDGELGRYIVPFKSSMESDESAILRRIERENLGNGIDASFFEGTKELEVGRLERRIDQTSLERSKSQFSSRHWDEPNVVAHIRMSDRIDTEGKKVLLVDEIQSDWHQQGRKKGYRSGDVVASLDDLTLEQLQSVYQRLDGNGYATLEDDDIEDRNALLGIMKDNLESWRDSNESVDDIIRDARGRANVDGVPNAPFKTTWPMLAMKRMIRYAAEHGYDRIAWTPGEHQAERYDLSKQVDAIYAAKDTYLEDTYNVSVEKNGNIIDNQETMSPSELESYLGKEMAQKIVDQAQEAGKEIEFRGLDLKVGGEGMKGFYDKILPAEVGKYIKKWGSKVGQIDIITNNEYTVQDFANGVTEEQLKDGREYGEWVPVHSIDITDAMRASVVQEGQPLFSQSEKLHAPLKASQVKEHISKISDNWKHGPTGWIHVVQSVNDLPEELVGKAGARALRIEGVYDPGSNSVYLVADNLPTVERAQQVLLHEVVGHSGMEALLGPKFQSFLKEVVSAYGQSGLQDISQMYGFDLKTEQGRLNAAREKLARMAEAGERPGLLQRLYAAVREALRGMGFTIKLTDGDIRALLDKAQQALRGERDLASFVSDASYALRSKPAPQKTITGYKLFRVNKKHPGQIFPLYVNSHVPTEMGVWLDAEFGDNENSKLGKLAPRPGWHMADSPASTHIGKKANPRDGKPSFRSPDHVWAEVEVAADQDWQPEANRRASVYKDKKKRGQIIPKTAEIRDEIPVDGFYRYKTNANMMGNWIIAGAIKVKRILTDDEVAQLNTKMGFQDLPRTSPMNLADYGFTDDNRIAYSYAGAQATGFMQANALGLTFEGPYDRKTRFEIDDSNATARFDRLPSSEGAFARLSSVLNHSELFRQYPQLDDVIVKSRAGLSGYAGIKKLPEGAGYLVLVNPDKVKKLASKEGNTADVQLKKVLLHELQHAIQSIEGFARGGTPGSASQYASNKDYTPDQAYKYMAGEIEARDASARSELTDEERKNTWTYSSENILPSQAIVAYEDRGPAYSLPEHIRTETQTALKTLSESYAEHGEGSILQRILKSPEWWKHPVLKRLYQIAGEERPERVHQIIHEVLHLQDVLAPLATLKKTNKEAYGQVQDALISMDEKGMHWEDWTDNQGVAHEGYKTKYGSSLQGEVVTAIESVRNMLDRALDLQRGKVKEVIDQLEKGGLDPKKIVVESREDGDLTIWGLYQEMGDLRGSYFPRKREPGDWAVTSTKDGQKYREHFRTRWQANRVVQQYTKEGRSEVSGPIAVEREPESIYQNLNILDMQKFIESALKRTGIDGDEEMLLKRELFGEAATLLKERGFRSSRIRRQQGPAVKGYVEDPIQAVGLYAASMAGGVAKSEAASNMIAAVKEGIDERKDPQRYDLAKEYIAEQLKNPDRIDRMIAMGKSIITFKYLGFSPKTIAVNATSLLTVTPAAIHQYAMAGKGNFFKIGRALSGAMKDFTRVMTGQELKDKYEQAFMAQLKGSQDLEQYTRDAMSHLAGAYGQGWSRVMGWSMWGFQKSESWVRGTTMLAAYRLAKEQRKTHEQAMELARKASNKAHGSYGKASMPTWAMGSNPAAKIGQMGYTYGKFAHNYVQMLYDLGMDKRNLRAFAFALMAPAVVGGAGATLLYPVIMGIVRAIMRGFLDDDRDPERMVHDQIRKSLGETAEYTYRYGLAGLVGTDISSSLSVGLQPPKNLTDLAGPFGGVVKDVGKAGHFLATGQPQRAFEAVAPTPAANISRAIRELSGATTTDGNRVWDERGRPYMPGAGESVARAGGFKSARRGTAEERVYELKREEANFSERRDTIYERYRAYIAAGKRDPDAFKAIMDDVRTYNANVKKSGRVGIIPFITPTSMQSQLKKMARPSKGQLRALTQ